MIKSCLGDTRIWYIKKQKWGKGPYLPEDKHPYKKFCYLAVNSSAVLFLSGIDAIDNPSRKATMFNFETKKWSNYPDFPFITGFLIFCTSNLMFRKNYQTPLVVTLLGK